MRLSSRVFFLAMTYKIVSDKFRRPNIWRDVAHFVRNREPYQKTYQTEQIGPYGNKLISGFFAYGILNLLIH